MGTAPDIDHSVNMHGYFKLRGNRSGSVIIIRLCPKIALSKLLSTRFSCYYLRLTLALELGLYAVTVHGSGRTSDGMIRFKKDHEPYRSTGELEASRYGTVPCYGRSRYIRGYIGSKLFK